MSHGYRACDASACQALATGNFYNLGSSSAGDPAGCFTFGADHYWNANADSLAALDGRTLVTCASAPPPRRILQSPPADAISAAQQRVARRLARLRGGYCMQTMPWFHWQPTNPTTHNFGDDLNVPFARAMLNVTRPQYVHRTTPQGGHPLILGIGSVIPFATRGSVLAGPGFLTEPGNGGRMWTRTNLLDPTSLITAVRGPRTAAVLRSRGFRGALAYGDPGLFMHLVIPEYAHLRHTRGGGMCIIAHILDRGWQSVASHAANANGMKYISLNTYPPIRLLEQLVTCDIVASSALHGLVAAAAFGIHSVWLWDRSKQAPDGVRGGLFKYHDFFEGCGMRQPVIAKSIADVTRHYNALRASSNPSQLADAPPSLESLETLTNAYIDAFPFQRICVQPPPPRHPCAMFDAPLYNTDGWGTVLSIVTLPHGYGGDPMECCAACLVAAHCEHFVVYQGKCYLKPALATGKQHEAAAGRTTFFLAKSPPSPPQYTRRRHHRPPHRRHHLCHNHHRPRHHRTRRHHHPVRHHRHDRPLHCHPPPSPPPPSPSNMEAMCVMSFRSR